MSLPAFAVDSTDIILTGSETLFGEVINNTASLVYTLPGTTEAVEPIVSNEITFKVDRKVIFSLTDSHDGDGNTDADAITVKAGGNAITTYTLKNDSNAPISFTFPQPDTETTYSYSIGGGAAIEITNASSLADRTIALEKGTITPGQNDSVVITVTTSIPDDAVGGTITTTPFSVTAVEPDDAANIGSVIGVKAGDEITPTASTVEWAKTIIQTVSTDDLIDGTTIISNQPQKFRIASPVISLSKSVKIISDPITGALSTTVGSENYPKAIPGAIVQYTLTVINKGAGAANGIAVSDTIVDKLIVNDATFTPVYTVDGVAAIPAIAGQELTFNNISVAADSDTTDVDGTDGVYLTDGTTVITFTVKLK
jgi:uncharacterized repeat protein (TIGR01451 family)